MDVVSAPHGANVFIVVITWMIVWQHPTGDAKEDQRLGYMCALLGEVACSTEMVCKTATPPSLLSHLLQLLQVLQHSVRNGSIMGKGGCG